MTKYITYLSKTEEVLEIKPLNTRSLHICCGAIGQCVTHSCGDWGEECQLYGCGVSQICAAQCTKPSLKLNNDQSENDKSGGLSKAKWTDCETLETQKIYSTRTTTCAVCSKSRRENLGTRLLSAILGYLVC